MSDPLPCLLHEARIAVIESKIIDVKEETVSIHEWLKSIDNKVGDIQERLAKQNGALPHMSSDIVKLTALVEVHHQLIIENRLAATNTELRTHILWGVLATIGVALLGVLVKVLTTGKVW